MKTVIGQVLSSKPISLKKATSTLSTFVSTENGASPAICAYLRRALASFKELRQHEKELRDPRSKQRQYRSKSETLSDVSQKQKRDQPESNITSRNPIEKPTRIVVSDEGKREKHKKNKQKGVFGKFGDNGSEVGESRDTEIKVKIEPEENPGRRDEGNVVMESERKKHKKKRIIAEEIKEEKHKKNEQKGVFGKYGDNGSEVGKSKGTEIKVKIEPEENSGRRDEGNVGMESERKKHKKKKIIAEEIKEESKELGLADSYSVGPQRNKRKKKEINDAGDFKNNGIKTEDRDGGLAILPVLYLETGGDFVSKQSTGLAHRA
ncbi:hypothetical protein FH972_011407 [Carpinus fangiana]|uniref:Uncharacterized protein n=1 Tax=Carpinus fangiana TaxID=176857 RepID=A0A660KR94_9ROSI|nr:hypothetical protein FH972_011407 [Carpinus fangiana]